MRLIRDTNGREWTIDLNISTIRKLRARVKQSPTLDGVDVLDYASVLVSLSDMLFCADLLYETIRDEAESAGISAEDFGRSLKGRVLFDAVKEWTAEYLDFFPEPTAQDAARVLVSKLEKTRELQLSAAYEATTKLLAAAAEDVETRLGAILSEPSRSLGLEG